MTCTGWWTSTATARPPSSSPCRPPRSPPSPPRRPTPRRPRCRWPHSPRGRHWSTTPACSRASGCWCTAARAVGVYGVQLAAVLGAHVIATARAENEAFVRDLGAAEFLDHTSRRFDDELSGLDVVLDAVGGETLARSYGVLRPGGRLVTLVAPPDEAAAERSGVQATFFIVRPDHDELTTIARMVDDGRLRPVVAATYPLSEGRAAFESIGAPRPPGKTVLLVRP
ncbi:zinc-binding dehydrogenase [Actinoplanes sp. KI2]|uniref:zinc-binding dehydrogenase n=1 Tax=Actinoplanes sp. KI2 TaxID=2983315 RepID=UPI0021D56B72|nr:zinc-binding dehydrogenase [Actinoplanes sp. KI2]MCU7727804.1 zinc-binding dehydrogenase [Actinoplanes sp. KI2]